MTLTEVKGKQWKNRSKDDFGPTNGLGSFGNVKQVYADYHFPINTKVSGS